MKWLMPSETAPHERTWMAWPHAGYTLGDTDAEAAAARHTWAAVANAIVDFEPVDMVVDPSAIEVAREHLDARVTLHEAPLDDAWMRDIGPTFVVGEDGALGAVDWVFNGWGGQSWASWGKDSAIGAYVARLADATVVASPIVNEGGAIHVDSLGTVLVTETVQLDAGRNPDATRASIEAELARTLGATKVVWVPRGLTRDYEEFGTRGHIDIVATLPSPGVVLVHDQENPEHPDHAVSAQVIAHLESETDARGEAFEIVRIPAPATLFDDEGPVDYSYVNHLVVNGGVIACTFNDEHDERALDVLREVYPGRTVVGIDARELYARGGGIHCITQQQPATAR